MPKVDATGEGSKPTPHPAMWSQAILEALDEMVPPGRYLDPYAGTCKINTIAADNRRFYCVEIEPEWAARYVEWTPLDGSPVLEPFTGDCLKWMKIWKRNGTQFDGVVSSPVYGNRMSDHHNAKDASRRRGYRFQLGRMPTEGSTGVMYFWQLRFKDHHQKAVKLIGKLVRPGGYVFWNVKNFYKTVNGIEIEYDVLGWFVTEFEKRGFEIEKVVDVGTPGFREGENYEIRKAMEHIIVGRKR